MLLICHWWYSIRSFGGLFSKLLFSPSWRVEKRSSLHRLFRKHPFLIHVGLFTYLFNLGSSIKLVKSQFCMITSGTFKDVPKTRDTSCQVMYLLGTLPLLAKPRPCYSVTVYRKFQGRTFFERCFLESRANILDHWSIGLCDARCKRRVILFWASALLYPNVSWVKCSCVIPLGIDT